MTRFPQTIPIGPKTAYSALAILPLCLLLSIIFLRMQTGPFWQWFNLDPSYPYLFGALKMADFSFGKMIEHPGTPLQMLGAFLIRAFNLTQSSGEMVRNVLSDPEMYLTGISHLTALLSALALFALGVAGYGISRSLLPALVLQTGPFLSKQVIRQAETVTPESLLVFTTLILCFFIVRALRPGSLDNHRFLYALVFGAVIAFGTATKLTFLPMALAPIFLLGTWRSLIVYGASFTLFFILLLVPILPEWGVMFDWVSGLVFTSGFHGTGEAQIIDLSGYPGKIYKLSSRPLFFLPILLSLFFLAKSRMEKKQGRPAPELETRALAGIATAQIAQILVIAKHATAFYMIPAFILIGLSLFLLYRLAGTFYLTTTKSTLRFRHIVAALFGILVIAQTAGLWKMGGKHQAQGERALALDNALFSSCLNIPFTSASDPDYALHFGSYWNRHAFADQLAELKGRENYWMNVSLKHFNIQEDGLRDWHGLRNLREIVDQNHRPCVFMRGTNGEEMRKKLDALLPQKKFNAECSTRNESAFTQGIDCRGLQTGGEQE